MKKIKLGIIGLGSMGILHLNNSLRLRNADVVAVSDVSKSALRTAKVAGIKKTYYDYEQLLAEDEIDAVVIALPNHLHLPCVSKVAENGKHILLEKPIARDIAEAKEIISVCNKNSVKIMIGYPLRFNPIFCELKNKIESGCLGDIEGANAINISSGPFSERAEDGAPVQVPEWWFNKTMTGGGVLIDLGSHMINLLRWYFGEITDIKSQFSHRFNMDFEDSAICLAKFRSGTKAVIRVGWFSQELQLKVEIFGTAGHAQGQHSARNSFLVSLARKLLTDNAGLPSPYFTEINYFVNCVINDLNPLPSASDGLKDIEAISLAYRNEIRLT